MPYSDRDTQLEAQKEHYQKNKSKYKANLYAKRKRNFEYMLSLKSKSKCARCEENHPACLDFHHLDPNSKIKTVAKMLSDVSLKTLQEEISKCILLCANCHRKEHWVELEDRYFNQ